MKKALMIDNETCSTRPDAFLLQVGVGMMDLDTGNVLFPPTNFYIRDEDQAGRHLDPETFRWWMRQDRAVAASVANPVPALTLSAGDLFARLGEMAPDTVWAAPATFDLPQLKTLFGDKTPWSYKQQRCLTTLWRELDPHRKLAPPDNTMQHNAAADVDWQLRYLFALQPLIKRARGEA